MFGWEMNGLIRVFRVSRKVEVKSAPDSKGGWFGY